VENAYIILQQIYSGTVYKISSKSPKLRRRYYRNLFGLLFSGHSVRH